MLLFPHYNLARCVLGCAKHSLSSVPLADGYLAYAKVAYHTKRCLLIELKKIILFSLEMGAAVFPANIPIMSILAGGMGLV